jgi:hypothetical protein
MNEALFVGPIDSLDPVAALSLSLNPKAEVNSFLEQLAAKRNKP